MTWRTACSPQASAAATGYDNIVSVELRLAINGAEGDRTLNLSIANAALSQLSYRPGKWIILHQSNVENTPTQAKMKGVAVVQRGPGAGLFTQVARPIRNVRPMIFNRFRILRAALVAMTIGLAILGPAQCQPAQAQEAPFGLVDWRPIAGNPVFAGTGSNTWDRKIRERGYILMGDDGVFHLWYTGYDRDRPDTVSLGHATSRDGTHWTRDPHNPIFTGSWVEDVCVV